jgi:hypothetical protein
VLENFLISKPGSWFGYALSALGADNSLRSNRFQRVAKLMVVEVRFA